MPFSKQTKPITYKYNRINHEGNCVEESPG